MPQLGTKSDGTPFNKRLSTRTRKLSLFNQDLLSVDLSILGKAPNLEGLDLTNNPLRTLDLAPLAQCTNLAGLSFTTKSPVDLAPLAQCPNLQRLTIYGKSWTTLDLTPLAALPHLESLHLISKVATLDLSPLAQHATLTRVSLQFPALQQLDLEPLAACAGLTSLNLEYIPVQNVTLFPWLNLRYLTLNNVPVTALDLVPLAHSALNRLRLVKHALSELDLTPLINTEILESIFITPATRMLLDDVYVRNTNHIVSPEIFSLVRKRACVATGRYTRLTVLIQELTASPPPSREIGAVDMDTFWILIEEARTTAARRTDDFALELTRILYALPSAVLSQFKDRFWEAMRSLGPDVHHIVYEVNGGCSDDAFIDFRQWLITQGQTAFQSVVDNPQILHEWGEGGVGFEEGIVSTPLYRVQQARGTA